MRFLVKLLFTLLPLATAAQYSTKNLRTVHKKAADYVLTPDSLARQLITGFTTDREKVTSIFRWITENISYNVRPYHNSTRNPSSPYFLDDDEDTGALKSLSERVALDVLNRRIAFCDGYSRLFTTLCEYAGIKSEVITGYASTSSRGRFTSNHRWNAVFLDSSWHLLDATWASGHLTFGSNNFVHNYNNRYFLTPAAEFAQDHYPEELQWSLLPQPPEMSEFRHSPFKTNAYVKNNIRSYHPETGIIQASPGDTLYFELETTAEKNNMMVLDTALVDSAVIAAAAADFFKNTSTITGNKVKYKYIVRSSSDKWLNVVMNDEVVVRYKLHLRKIDTATR